MKHFSGHKKIVYSSFLALSTVLVVSFFREPIIISLLLLSFCSFLMLVVDGNKKSIYLFLAAFIMGPLAEATCIYFGAWQYSKPFILGFPLYLPFVWGNASLYIKRIMFYLEK